jgi:hypothetical protein
MKRSRNIVITLLLVVLLIPACNRQKEPSVELQNGRFVTGNVEIVPGGVLLFKWIAEKGEADLESFTIRVNGDDVPGYPNTSIDPDLYYDSTFMEGPVVRGDYTFAFIATDTDGNFGEKAIVVSVE